MKKQITIITILLAAAVIVVGIFYFLVYNKPHTDYIRAKVDMEIGAADLYHAFTDNEQAAEAAYIGKILKIDGSVGYIEEHATMLIVGFVFQEGLFGAQGIRCIMLENQYEQATALQPGKHVRIKGLCTGFTGHDVVLEHCSFVDST